MSTTDHFQLTYSFVSTTPIPFQKVFHVTDEG